MFCETFKKVFPVTFKKNPTNKLGVRNLKDSVHFFLQSTHTRGTLDKVFSSDEVSNFVKNF